MHSLAAPFPVYFAKVKSSNYHKIILFFKRHFFGSFFPHIIKFVV